MHKYKTLVSVKELRQNLDNYITQIREGRSFTIIKRSQPVFKITPVDAEETWEEVIDFNKIKKGGVNIEDILSRI